VESGKPFTESTRRDWRDEKEGDASAIDGIARGMQILLWQLVLYLAISLVGSLAFLTGRFADFPYGWF
jgi:hypothetical protein